MRAAAAATAAPRRDGDPLAQLVGALREQLSDRVLEPLDLMLLAADRIQAAVDDAVQRRRLTRRDAEALVGELVRRGREQTDDVLGNLDQLLGRGIDQLHALARTLDPARRHADSVDLLLQGADRARAALRRARRRRRG